MTDKLYDIYYCNSNYIPVQKTYDEYANYNIIINEYVKLKDFNTMVNSCTWRKKLNIIYNNFTKPVIIINAKSTVNYNFYNLIHSMKAIKESFGIISNSNTWYIKDRCIKEMMDNKDKNSIINDFINLEKLDYDFNNKGIFETDILIFTNKKIFNLFLEKINEFDSYFKNDFILLNYIINKFMQDINIIPISIKIFEQNLISKLNIYNNKTFINNKLKKLIY